MLKVLSEVFPVHSLFLTAPVEPLMNQFGRRPIELYYCICVSADAVVLIMPPQFRREGLPPDFCLAPVSYPAQPVIHGVAFCGVLLSACLPPQLEFAFA